MASLLLRAVMSEVLHEEGPRTDEAHISLENVQEFRKFIQAGAAHQLAESRESIRVGQELPIGSSSIGHRAEFVQGKGLSMKPGASLHEQERPTMDGPRRQCDESDDRKKEWQKADGHNQIQGALPGEESCNSRLGGVNNVVHNGINFREVRRAMKSVDNRRTEVLRQCVVLGATTTWMCCLRGPA